MLKGGIMRFRFLVFALFMFNTILPLSFGPASNSKLNYAEAASKTVVINSFKVAGVKTTDEFVELKNIGPATINLLGWQLAKLTASGSKTNLVTSFQSLELTAGTSLVIGHKDSTKVIDLAYSTTGSIAEDNTIVLYSDAGKTVLDMVGFGKATVFEGKALPAARTDTWVRVGDDTDNNADDFQKEIVSIATEVKDYSGICLTEIMPDPGVGNEEWVEIYNSEVTKDIGGLIIADKLGSTKKYTVPEGTIIEEGKYLVFYAKITGISLNNDGDGVQLLDSSGNVIDDSGESYGASKTGLSYSFDGEKWYWTKTPTPGAQNIIALQTEAEKKGKTARTSSLKPKATKGKAPKVEVLGATNEEESIFAGTSADLSENDRLLGQGMIVVAIFGGLLYTVFVNRKKLNAVFKRERKRYRKAWSELRQKVQRERGLPSLRGTWWRQNAIYERISHWTRNRR